MVQELKDGQEVTINVPFTYTIGDEGFRTDKVLKTVQDCKDEALAEIEAGVLNEPEVFMEVVISPYSVEKKDEIEKIFIDQMAAFGIDLPENYEDIVQFIYEDVCETADPVNWTSEDVRIGFRRWIESQK
jgi:hypothetical protein